jgi:hypothetical protein
LRDFCWRGWLRWTHTEWLGATSISDCPFMQVLREEAPATLSEMFSLGDAFRQVLV